MTIAIADFTMDKDYADDTILTEDQIDAALVDADIGSVTGYMNQMVKDNLLQLAQDIMPTAYAFTNDGVPSLTNTVFDKQVDEDYYNSGDIALGTIVDADWADVDATNAALTFTPEHAGKYKITFTFTHRAIGTATTLSDWLVRFRLTDGTTASRICSVECHMGAPAGGANTINTPVCITYVLDLLAVATTVKLQKRIDIATDLATHVMAASAAYGELYMLAEKI